MTSSTLTVTIFGSSRCAEGTACYEEARELGALLAKNGYAIATGGYTGTMEAASRGAAEAGGHVIGVTSDQFVNATPNPWLHEKRHTTNLMERINALTRAGDALVAVMGGIGTLAEVTYAWNLLQLQDLTPRPFLLLGENWHPILDAIFEHSHVGTSVATLPNIVSTPQEILEHLRTSLPSPRRPLA